MSGAGAGDAVALVLARGGSRRVPRKNVRPFLGVPAVARPIGSARRSGLFSRIVVSTDDPEITAVAREAGASVPFRRSAALADDHATTAEVVLDAVDHLDRLGQPVTGPLCVLYGTSVFARPQDLVESHRSFVEAPCDVLFSAAAFPAPVQRAWRRGDDGTAEMVWPEHRSTRSQDLEPRFHDLGQFYWSRPSYWRDHSPDRRPRARMHVLPSWRAVDIDTEEDWVRAEALLRSLGDDAAG